MSAEIEDEDFKALRLWIESREDKALAAVAGKLLSELPCCPGQTREVFGNPFEADDVSCYAHHRKWPCVVRDITESIGLVRDLRYLENSTNYKPAGRK